MRKKNSKKHNKIESLEKLKMVFNEINMSADLIKKSLKVIKFYSGLNIYSNKSEPQFVLLD